MGVVTGIVPSPRKEGRYDLMIDGESGGVVSLELIERLGLRVGLALDAGRSAELAEAVAGLATFDRALGMLAVQQRSERDLRRRLLQKGEPEARVDAALARLAASGLVNDEAYARQFTRSRVLGRGASRRRVRDELFKRGVGRGAADEAIAEVFEEEAVDETGLVEAAARKKLRSLGGLDAATRRRRLYAFLVRRGHDGSAIREVVARVLSREDVEALDESSVDED
ncbi:MAG: regulatory protein RecX [Gemmatirosa sp.]|nr:regulatory protein RecX [Gemmatirosa sp.]